MHHEREHSSKDKGSNACKDKIFVRILEYITIVNMLREYLTKEDCNKDSACKFLFLLKRRKTTKMDKIKEVSEE